MDVSVQPGTARPNQADDPGQEQGRSDHSVAAYSRDTNRVDQYQEWQCHPNGYTAHSHDLCRDHVTADRSIMTRREQQFSVTPNKVKRSQMYIRSMYHITRTAWQAQRSFVFSTYRISAT